MSNDVFRIGDPVGGRKIVGLFVSNFRRDGFGNSHEVVRHDVVPLGMILEEEPVSEMIVTDVGLPENFVGTVSHIAPLKGIDD